MIKIKRIYEKPESQDGKRVLIDRMWPRGVKKEKAALDFWMKDLAPSPALRKWFGHKENKWPEFRKKYRKELSGKTGKTKELKAMGKNITLLYAAKDEKHNNAAVLKEYLEKRRIK